jgi:hypothetical protein
MPPLVRLSCGQLVGFSSEGRDMLERVTDYFYARLADQFDALVHFDETRAVEPLECTSEWQAGEVPETFLFGV